MAVPAPLTSTAPADLRPLRALAPRPVPYGPLPTGLGPPRAGEPQLWVADADGRWADAEGAALLDREESLRAGRFDSARDRHRYVVAHVLLRRLAGAHLGLAPADVVISREPCGVCGRPGGRPVLPGSGLHFSLSHSASTVLLAFARTPVGVDVEAASARGTADELAASLHPREHAELAALPAAGRDEAFLRCWTRKEAHLKGEGAGLAHGLAGHYVGTGPAPASPRGWRLWDIVVGTGERAALALAVAGSVSADRAGIGAWPDAAFGSCN
ncbi:MULTISPECIES: 4'-phosphopantetheinyl transferase family protein [Streptomyces]|uniref:4'-phosphopantetheinyl transferase family protein n=1 Tax=Streptomyces TaxID=1883 RepID=UPI00099C4E56|nr:4'-phosphopantetheinyl transferase superfamily protein [Streptomyces sp. CFMR 7]